MKNLITAFVVLLLVSCKDDTKTQPQPSKPDAAPLIAERIGKNAFTTENIEMQHFTIDAAKGGSVKGKKGTQLTIPKNAFVTADGKSVTGKVSIGLKEALSMSDIVFGGLTTTSDGKVLSTGGMLYIEAKHGDVKLELADSKSIKTIVPTKDFKSEMLLFTGEQDENGSINWVDPLDVIEKEKEKEKVVDDSYFWDPPKKNDPESPAPVKPVKNTGGITLRVNLSNPELLPEFIPFKDMAWKLVDESKYSEGDTKNVWRYVMVERSEKQGVYILTFKGVDGDNDKTKKLEVVPVFKGQDYEKAMAEYEKKYDAFIKDKNEREAREKAEFERLEKQEKEEMARLSKADRAKRYANSYIFEVQKLGWHNCDYFYRDKTAVDVIVKAEITNGGEDAIYTYLVLKEQKICIPGYAYKSDAFGFTAARMPLGITATIIALSTDSDGNLKYISKDVTIEKETLVALALKASTKEDMKKALQMNIDQ